MGRIAHSTIAILKSDAPPAKKHAAVERYLYKKVQPELLVEENQMRMWAKTDIIERAVGPEARAIVRHECYRFEQNMALAQHRKALGTSGINAVDRINRAEYSRQIENITRQYLAAKVTSRASDDANRDHLDAKRAALLANVAPSCAPFVARSANACIADIPILRLRHAENIRRNRSNPSSFGGGSGGGGGA
jgi:hypothetical protein